MSLDWVVTSASMLPGWGFSRNFLQNFSLFSKWNEIFFTWFGEGWGLVYFKKIRNMSPLCFSYYTYLCFWQLATSIHSIRVQGSVTKTFCGGTTGHPACSYWHERPEPRGAIQICKGNILFLLLWKAVGKHIRT